MNLCRRTLLSAAALMPVAGCVAAQQWRPTSTTAEPQTLAILDGGLLLGSSGPALTGPSGPIPVTATTGYGREARWVSLATAQQRILGIGATHGGAHANARWAVFAGTTAGIDEQEQTFDVFHGWGAGTLVAAAFVGTAPVLVTSAMAGGLRSLARFMSAPRGMRNNDLMREVGVPAWKLDVLRRQSHGWDPDGVGRAIRSVARADAAVKGQASDPAYALEKMVLDIVRARPSR